jgi:hypothetical protein
LGRAYTTYHSHTFNQQTKILIYAVDVIYIVTIFVILPALACFAGDETHALASPAKMLEWLRFVNACE